MNIEYLYGLLGLNFWGYALVTFLSIQLTFMAITLYLHRDACHRSLNLHPALRHVFRFWLWFSTSMLTKEWVAVHRKHHARCETADDPHSPQVYGLKKVLGDGVDLYRKAAKDPATLEKFGRGTPDDWMERNLYTRFHYSGVVSLAIIDLVLFGIPGITIFALQMLATPVMAAGVINGIGHHTGYRNFECPDASRNVMPWGLLIAGEELHNNHHAFPSSAKFSIRRWEFDIGWLYIKVFSFFGLAKVIRIAPQPLRSQQHHVDIETLRAVIVARMHVMRDYARKVTVPVLRDELRNRHTRASGALRTLLVRESSLLNEHAHRRLAELLDSNAALKTVHDFHKRLQVLWDGAHHSNEVLLQHLKDWIVQAEASGIQALRDYAVALRGYSLKAA